MNYTSYFKSTMAKVCNHLFILKHSSTSKLSHQRFHYFSVIFYGSFGILHDVVIIIKIAENIHKTIVNAADSIFCKTRTI